MSSIRHIYSQLLKTLKHYYNRALNSPYGKGLNVIKDTIQFFIDHDTFTQGAALSYYMVLSIVPMLIIVISLLGFFLGPMAATNQIKETIQNFIGIAGAEQLQDIVKAAYKPGKNWIATVAALVVLIIGATSVFQQLRQALNFIWDIGPQKKQVLLKFLLSRVFSFAMIVCLAFLMLVSLVVHALLAGFDSLLNNWLSGFSVILLKISEDVFSLCIVTLLFSFIYKFMSDAKLKWHTVWWGGFFTALLFTLGKYLIIFYIGSTNVAGTYGAAGGIVVILVWVFYSSQILFFGAEFTRALAIERGVSLNGVPLKPDGKPNETYDASTKTVSIKRQKSG